MKRFLFLAGAFWIFSASYVSATTQGFIEIPRSTVTGIGLLYGWLCDAQTVSISFSADDHAYLHDIYYGSERYDTLSVCGDADNGFYVLMNWNILGDGEHTVHLYADGELVDQSTFTVVTPGEEFVIGLSGGGTITLSNGMQARLEWFEPMQNFIIVEFIGPNG